MSSGKPSFTYGFFATSYGVGENAVVPTAFFAVGGTICHFINNKFRVRVKMNDYD